MSELETYQLAKYCQQYDYTAYLSQRDWAYEYMRRNTVFQQDAWRNLEQSPVGRKACYDITIMRMDVRQPEAEKWGIKFFPNPEIPAPKAAVFWTEEADPRIVEVTVIPRSADESHDLFEQTIKKCRMVHLTDQNQVEHLVHIGRGSSVQVKCIGHTLVTSKPVKTFFSVGAVGDLEQRQEIARRATDVYGDHILSPPEFSNAARLLRNGLIALDCSEAGLTDREIACIIEGPENVESGLSRGDRSLVRRVKNYRARARELRDGGYRGLLFPTIKARD